MNEAFKLALEMISLFYFIFWLSYKSERMKLLTWKSWIKNKLVSKSSSLNIVRFAYSKKMTFNKMLLLTPDISDTSIFCFIILSLVNSFITLLSAQRKKKIIRFSALEQILVRRESNDLLSQIHIHCRQKKFANEIICAPFISSKQKATNPIESNF